MMSLPDEELRRLEPGRISGSRTAIVGGEATLFHFDGGTGRHGQYVDRGTDPIGASWAESVGALHARLSPRVHLISMWVPNKESCLPRLYPLPIAPVPTRAWGKVRQMLSADDGVMFARSLVGGDRDTASTPETAWLRTDSRPSPHGSALLANELLLRLGLPTLEIGFEPCAPTRFEGDLAREWGPTPVGEMVTTRVGTTAPVPSRVDEGSWPRWENPEAEASASLVIVGDGCTGTGDDPRHLAHWMARAFRRTTVVNAPVVPVDVLETLAPDVVVYQASERYLVGPAPEPVGLDRVGGPGGVRG